MVVLDLMLRIGFVARKVRQETLAVSSHHFPLDNHFPIFDGPYIPHALL
jgi:hypothetical protein